MSITVGSPVDVLDVGGELSCCCNVGGGWGRLGDKGPTGLDMLWEPSNEYWGKPLGCVSAFAAGSDWGVLLAIVPVAAGVTYFLPDLNDPP